MSKHVFHDAAQAWIAIQTATGEVLFYRSTQQSFLRLITTAAVLQPYGSPPLTNREAWTLYESFLADQRIGFSDEPPGIQAHWKVLALSDLAAPKRWMDDYLAAFAIAGGHQLVTTGTGFGQHVGLDLHVLSKASTQP